jgi:hypothetical protein
VDLWDLTRLLLRRWYFAVPMLLASVAVVVMAAKNLEPDYKSTGYMQLIPAPSAGKPLDPKAKPRPTNPWNDLGYAALANASIITVTDPSNLEKYKAEGLSDSVTIVLNEQTPLMEIEAVGSTEQQAASTVRHVIKQIQADVGTKQKQYGTLPEDTISTLVINDGSTPSLESGKVKRILIVAAGLGVLLTAAATIALDYWLRRRARRKAGVAAALDPSVERQVDRGTADVRDTGEKTRVLRPNREPQQRPTVYTSDHRKAEQARAAARPVVNGGVANGGAVKGGAVNGSAANGNGVVNGSVANGNGVVNGNSKLEDAPVDSTVILPTPYRPRRGEEKKNRP